MRAPRQAWIILVAIGVAATVVRAHGEPVVSGLPGEELLPAAMGVRSCGGGGAWNVERNGAIGRVGSSMINSGLVLSINGEKFAGFQPLMTSDGAEFVIRGRPLAASPGLTVQRRILVRDEPGGLRYLETLVNGSANTLIIDMALASNFSGNFKTFLTERGTSEPVIFGDRESGLLVLPGASQSTRAFLFQLGVPGGSIKPTISSQNRYGLTFCYRIELDPGETASIVHVVAQTTIPTRFDRRDLAATFEPYRLSNAIESLPPGLRRSVINGGVKSEERVSLSLASLGIEPGPRDVLAMGEATRIAGTAECDEFGISADYGEAVIPFERIAAIDGRSVRGDTEARVFLRDGQVFSGRVFAGNLRFTRVNGEVMELNVGEIDRLVLAEGGEDRDWPEGAVGLVETHWGDRIAFGSDGSTPLSGVTAWGKLRVPWDAVRTVKRDRHAAMGHRVNTVRGGSCIVFFGSSSLSLSTPVFGATSLAWSRVRGVVTHSHSTNATYAPLMPGGGAFLELGGDQRVTGVWEWDRLSVRGKAGTLDFAPAEIRTLERSGEGFRLETWDGSIAVGRTGRLELPLAVGDEEWQIPANDIVSVSFPPPPLGEAARAGMDRLIEQLGDEAWAVRERATRELAAFGNLARPYLEAERNRNEDPEVLRRLDRVLATLQK